MPTPNGAFGDKLLRFWPLLVTTAGVVGLLYGIQAHMDQEGHTGMMLRVRGLERDFYAFRAAQEARWEAQAETNERLEGK